MFALLIGQSMLLATGCSVLGFGIGAISDSSQSEQGFGIPAAKTTPLQVQENSYLQIFLKNGEQQEGKFTKLMKQKVGDENVESIVWFDEANNRQVSTQFADIERIVTIDDEHSKWLHLEEAASIQKESLIEISLKNGEQASGQFLLFQEQKIGDENIAFIEWYDKANNRQVSTQVADIERIVVKQKRNGRRRGLGIGAALDVLMIILLARGDNGSGSGGGFGGFSFNIDLF